MSCIFERGDALLKSLGAYIFKQPEPLFTSTIYHFHMRKPVWHSIFLHLPLKNCSLRFFLKEKIENNNNIFIKCSPMLCMSTSTCMILECSMGQQM